MFINPVMNNTGSPSNAGNGLGITGQGVYATAKVRLGR